MITCKNCHAFARAKTLGWNKWTCEFGKLTIETCKRCGKDDGDWDDGEELEWMFQVGSYESQEIKIQPSP